MKMHARLRRLEMKSIQEDRIWAVFNINYYADPIEQEEAQQRLMNDYLSNGHKVASCNIFVNEIPGKTDAVYEEKLLCTYTLLDS